MRKALLPVAMAVLASVLASSLAKAQEAVPPSQPQGGSNARPDGHHADPGMMLKNMLDQAGATDEQKAKAEAIMKAAHEKAEAATTPEEKRKIMREAMENIRNTVLTAEQRAKLPKPGAGGGMGMLDRVGATPEQKAKAEAIMKDAHEKAEAAQTPEEKRKIMREAMENVRNTVLTAEQRDKLPKPGEGGGPGGPGGHGAPGGGPGGSQPPTN